MAVRGGNYPGSVALPATVVRGRTYSSGGVAPPNTVAPIYQPRPPRTSSTIAPFVPPLGGIPPNFSGIPNATIGEVSRGKLASTAKNANVQQLTCAALDALIPIGYGRVRLGALLANALIWDGFWVFWLIWCEGEIDSFELVTMNDVALPKPSTQLGRMYNHYLGTPEGNLCQNLQRAFGAQHIAFDETLPGIAYSVIKVPIGDVTSTPNFNAIVKGRKIYDPRDNSQTLGNRATYKWSDNPALVAADFLTDPIIGAGLTVNWSSVALAAGDSVGGPNGRGYGCDELVGTAPLTERRRLASMVVDRDATVDNWIETMRAAASMFLVNNQGQVKFVPDADGTPVANFSHDNGDIQQVMNLALRDATQLPTVMEIQYTDTSVTPWATTSSAQAIEDGVISGVTPYRKSVVPMPWITRATQANREAIERLNKLWLRSLNFTVVLFDEGLRLEPGDLITLTYPDAGFSALPLRVVGSEATETGWAVTVEKHDVGAYSSVVQDVPTTPSTNLPSPNEPIVVTGLKVAEDVYQMQTGMWADRLVVTWDSMLTAFPFVGGYWVTILLAGVVVQGPVVVPPNSQTYVSPPLAENETYQVSVQLASVTGALSVATTKEFLLNGRMKPPSDVPGFVEAYEVAGEVRLMWLPATDLDLTAHELRYSSIPGTWESATLLDRVAVPSVRYVTRSIPAGAWRIWIKALDSVRQISTDPNKNHPWGQYSENATYVDISVTSDVSAFVAGTYDFVAPLVENMTAIGAGGWITDFNESWNSIFTNAMNTYTRALNTYHTAQGQSAMLTEAHDFGALLTGNWVATTNYVDLVNA